MNLNTKLKNLDKDIKYILISFLITMGFGIFTGLAYLYYTTESSSKGIIDNYVGTEDISYEDWDENLDKPMKTKKYLHDMLELTHTHVTSFAFISFLLGIIFYFNSIIIGKLKIFLIIEPFVSTLITFSSLWIMRYFNQSFVYLVILSSTLLYLCWIIMLFVSLYELIFSKKSNP
ncbi:MAG: hypothetical protein CMG49_04440 [Candidatus Marinimicrobia bacterium]|nr:hypothetical protein [Candidatus Neomarinimicrobiota bacterium]